MELKMITIILYAGQKKRHRCIEQTFGLCRRRQGWVDLREQHWNVYIIKCETDHQPRLDAWDKCSGLVHWEDSERWDGEGGRRGDRDGEHIKIYGWFMSMYGKKPLQYCKVISLQLIKINERKKKKSRRRIQEKIKEPTCQCRRHKRLRFEPWVGKIPWSRKWLPTPVFLPGEPHGKRRLAGTVCRVAKSWTWLKWLIGTHSS